MLVASGRLTLLRDFSMNFVVLREERRTPTRMQKYMVVQPLLVYSKTNLGMVSWFFEFERVADLIRHVDYPCELSCKDHNVEYHWRFFVPLQTGNGTKKKTLLKLYPQGNGTLWRVIVFNIQFLADIFEGTQFELIDIPNLVWQFQTSLTRDVTTTQADGRLTRLPYISNGCAEMFKKMLQYQATNLDSNVCARMMEYLARFPRFVQRRLARYSGLDNFVTVLSQLPGRKIVFVTEAYEDEAEILPDIGRVQGFVWVAPWAEHMLKDTHREVDCSFRALAPYTYYVPMAVLGNTGLPCGLSVFPSESAEIFDNFEDALPFSPKTPVLSDMGGAIKKFCNNRGLEQFFCHRHIIERMGSNSVAGHLVQHILQLLTIASIDEHLPQFVSDVTVFYNAGDISDEQIEKLKRYLGISFQSIDGKLTGNIDEIDAHTRASWAIGTRGGISRCSNHCESFHMHLNSKKRANTSLTTKVRSVARVILQNYSKFNNRLTKMLRDKIRSLSVMYSGCQETCECPEYIRNRLMYQTEGFCRHTCANTRCTPDSTLFVSPETNTISTSPVEFVHIENIHHVGPKPEDEPSEEELATLKERGSFWAPIPGLIRSLAFLLDCDCEEAAWLLMKWCHRNSIDPEQLSQMSPEDLSILKYQILHTPKEELTKV